MIDQSTVRGRIIASALRCAAAKPWREVTLRDISEGAAVNLAEVRREFHGKGEILAAFTRHIDDEVLAARRSSPLTESKRDRLFEVIMARLDAMAPYRSSLRSMLGEVSLPDPAGVRALLSSQAWMLQAAGIGTDGSEGALRVAGLASLYASVVRTWIDDDDPGLARTMAVLDRGLRRGERTLESVEGVVSRLRQFGSAIVGCGRRSETKAPGTEVDAPNSPSI